MNQVEMLKRIAELESKLAKAEVVRANMRVSESGYIDIFGLPGKGRFSISLPPKGWDVLLTMQDTIKAFVEKNREQAESRFNSKYSKAIG